MRSEPKNATASPVRDTASLAFPCCRAALRGWGLGEYRQGGSHPSTISSYRVGEAGRDFTASLLYGFSTSP